MTYIPAIPVKVMMPIQLHAYCMIESQRKNISFEESVAACMVSMMENEKISVFKMVDKPKGMKMMQISSDDSEGKGE